MRVSISFLVFVFCLQGQDVFSSATQQELNDEQWPDNAFLRGYIGEWIGKPPSGGVSGLFKESFVSQEDLDVEVQKSCLSWAEEHEKKTSGGRYFLSPQLNTHVVNDLVTNGHVDNKCFSQLEKYLIYLSSNRIAEKLGIKR